MGGWSEDGRREAGARSGQRAAAIAMSCPCREVSLGDSSECVDRMGKCSLRLLRSFGTKKRCSCVEWLEDVLTHSPERFGAGRASVSDRIRERKLGGEGTSEETGMAGYKWI